MSVGARILKWLLLRAYAGPTYGPPQTVNVYSDPGSGLTTVDGDTMRSVFNEAWLMVHNGAGNFHTTTAATLYVQVIAGSFSATWNSIRRAIMTFSLAAIPSGALIVSARFCLRGMGKTDTGGDKPQIAVFQSFPVADNDLADADYQRLYDTPLSNAIDYDSFTTTGFNYFTLNDQGLALVVPGQICRLGLREAKFDAPNIMPPWSSGKIFRLFGASRDNTTVSYRPYLEVTYRPVL
jgi:hypothetical protein